MDLNPVMSRLGPLVRQARRALLTGPVEADGDSLGATLALASVLRAVNPELDVVTVCIAPVPRRYGFLSDIERLVGPDELRGPFDLAFLLDGVRHRIGPVGEFFDSAATRVLVDHHVSSDPDEYDLALLDVHRASTCEIIYDLARHPQFDVEIDRAMAQQLYTGIAYDTGTFRYSCTTPDTLRLAADLLQTGIDAQQIIERVFLDASYIETVFRGGVMSSIELAARGAIAHASITRDRLSQHDLGDGATEGLINSLVFIEGVEVAFLLVERRPGRIKVSFRSRGAVNVAQVASDLSPMGGGHDRAAGVTLQGALADVHQRVLRRVLAAFPLPDSDGSRG